MKKMRLAAAATALSLLAAIAPASAQVREVPVTAEAGGGTRTVLVEDLLGAELTSLDFGSGTAVPFRIRVIDDAMSRSGFSVSVAMTKLYRAAGDGITYDRPVESEHVGIDYPVDPLNIQDVTARVQPVVDLAGTITGPICAALTLAGASSCAISLDDVTGKVQSLPIPVDLDDLTNLPLVPQAGTAGTFDDPAFAGVAVGAPGAATATDPTELEVLNGLISTGAIVGEVNALLDTMAGPTEPLTDLVDLDTAAAALRTALGGPVYDLLDPSVVEAILETLGRTVTDITGVDLLGQAGTYLSFPVLELDAPDDTVGGTYRGTMVVTALQG